MSSALVVLPPLTQRWGPQVVVGAGALLAGAYVVKQYVLPFTSQAYERWAGKPLFGQSAAERAAEARTAELIAKAIQVTSHSISPFGSLALHPAYQQHLHNIVNHGGITL